MVLGVHDWCLCLCVVSVYNMVSGVRVCVSIQHGVWCSCSFLCLYITWCLVLVFVSMLVYNTVSGVGVGVCVDLL